MSGPYVARSQLVRQDGERSVLFRFVCRQDCAFYTCERGWNHCDWRRPEDNTCDNLHAQIDAVKELMEVCRDCLRKLKGML